jgi:hypothetical protein
MKDFLSASNGGAGIAVKNNNGDGTIVHDAGSAKAALSLWLSNRDDAAQNVRVQIGDGEHAAIVVPARSTVLAVSAWPVSGRVRVIGDKPGVVSAFGYIERQAA